jgi:type IV pilus assembly protein PilE
MGYVGTWINHFPGLAERSCAALTGTAGQAQTGKLTLIREHLIFPARHGVTRAFTRMSLSVNRTNAGNPKGGNMPVSSHSDRRSTSPARTRLRQAQASRTRGFTLIELMITVAVIAILAAIAVPSYYQYTLRSNRSAAESVMQEIASAQERYMVDSRQFAGALTTLGYTVPPSVLPNYDIVLAKSGSVSYTVTATPINSQVRDTGCKTLTLNGDGSKTASTGATNCWR